jgi:hypothetical protein
VTNGPVRHRGARAPAVKGVGSDISGIPHARAPQPKRFTQLLRNSTEHLDRGVFEACNFVRVVYYV